MSSDDRKPTRQSIATRWSMIRGAAEGSGERREEFARRYAPVVRAYLLARWAKSERRDDVDDAVQEVFVQCFREGGVLACVDSERSGGFRAYLYGVVRNVALKLEAKAHKRRGRAPDASVDLDAVPGHEEDLSRVFDRAFAMSVLREARERMASRCNAAGEERARRRYDLLTLRFHEGLTIKEIAQRWGVDSSALYAEQARACLDYRAAIGEVLSALHPGTPGEIKRQSAELLELLGP